MIFMVENINDVDTTKLISIFKRLQKYILENEDIYLTNADLFKYSKMPINEAIFKRAFAVLPLDELTAKRVYTSAAQNQVKFNFKEVAQIFNLSPILNNTLLENYCPNCLGIQESVECENCDQGREECEYCEGAGRWDCGECDGRGYVDCGECGGDNSVDCGECFGVGELENECENCDGDGFIEVAGEEGEKECPDCEGEGTITEECEMCDGDGQVACDECDDDGDISCEYCYGEGVQSCDECDGEGEEVCNACGGAFEPKTCETHEPERESFSKYLPKDLQEMVKNLPNFKIYRGKTKKLKNISPNTLSFLITPRAIAVRTGDYFVIRCVFEVTNNLEIKFPRNSMEYQSVVNMVGDGIIGTDIYTQAYGRFRGPISNNLHSISFEADDGYNAQRFSSHSVRNISDALSDIWKGSEIIWSTRETDDLTSILLVSDFNIGGGNYFMNWDGSPFF